MCRGVVHCRVHVVGRVFVPIVVGMRWHEHGRESRVARREGEGLQIMLQTVAVAVATEGDTKQ